MNAVANVNRNDSANGEKFIRQKSEALAVALRSRKFIFEDFGIANFAFQGFREPIRVQSGASVAPLKISANL